MEADERRLGRGLGDITPSEPIVFARTFALELFWERFVAHVGANWGAKTSKAQFARLSKDQVAINGIWRGGPPSGKLGGLGGSAPGALPMKGIPLNPCSWPGGLPESIG